MRRAFRVFFVVLLAAESAASLAANQTEDKAKPASLPVTAKLIANKKTYSLDLDGKTPEQFRETLKEAGKSGRYPKPPAVDLTLQLTNTSDKDVTIWGSGDAVPRRAGAEGQGRRECETAASIHKRVSYSASSDAGARQEPHHLHQEPAIRVPRRGRAGLLDRGRRLHAHRALYHSHFAASAGQQKHPGRFRPRHAQQ